MRYRRCDMEEISAIKNQHPHLFQLRNLLMASFFFAFNVPVIGQAHGDSPEWFYRFENHFSKLTTEVIDQFGKYPTPMWLASWDLEKEIYPFDFSRPDSIPNRVYLDRYIDAPAGSTLYWNLPDIAAAVHLSGTTARQKYSDAAKNFVESYFSKCTNKDGIILWGNHYYYHVLMDTAVKFGSSDHPRPVNFGTESGHLHEMRPILPPWELLYQWFPGQVENHIRAATTKHMVDTTGEFNRHANQKSEYAFIEAGSILIHALAFLFSKTHDSALLTLADDILMYSYSHRHPNTGLVPNSPTRDRWDKYASTTEIGLWASNILKASKFVPSEVSTRWLDVVEEALTPWLVHGFDEKARMFYGALNIATAEPILKTDDYPYQPDTYVDIWHPLFPRHDYPLQFATCCLTLYQLTGKDLYKKAAGRWFETVKSQLDNPKGHKLYAENAARIIYFLKGYGKMLGDVTSSGLASDLINGVIAQLYVPDQYFFRSHTGEWRYDGVDGIGLLYLSCMSSEYEMEDWMLDFF